MSRLAIVGKGRLGSALGTRLEAAGHEVRFADSSGGHGEAVAGADVVVLAVPYGAIAAALQQAGDLSGRVVWSCVNALKPDASGLAAGFDTSAAEEVAALAGGARVVAALPMFADTIASGDLDYGGLRPTMFLCSDDEEAKVTVATLVGDLGQHAVDAGTLQVSRLVEPAMMLLISLAYSTHPRRDVALSLLER
jgi:predicted dinucleotide-binding enzyme